ncbi:glycerophosphodiester phosphodiesterase family protein [Arenimonas sp. MALMAid1274]|uniref:glycerophosphodiester phosphodiesterase family protein n=1 Tax=Arenimonas sp. MALMAid1274 TaxID=3411630 RepID=UPI003B9DD4E3
MTRRPRVIAHRGASGYRPEHTLEAYALAIAQGADFIEPDLVATRDGVLVARHENELSDSTDVATHAEFATRRCRKCIDGIEREGWFTEDFTLDELRRLRARERLPALRPGSQAYDGQFGIATFTEIIALVQAAEANGRRVGLYPETKHPTWFAQEGRHHDGSRIGVSLGQGVVRELVAAGFTDPARVFIQSFEVGNLVELKRVWMPAAGVDWPLVQLLGDFERHAPYDLRLLAQGGEDRHGLRELLGASALGDPRCGSLAGPDALERLRDSHASAIGPGKDSLLPAGPAGPLHACLRAAQRLGLEVHAYTLRREHAGEAYGRRLMDEGVDGFFIDQPDLGVALRDAAVAEP